MAVPQIDVGPVRLLPPQTGAVDDQVDAAIVVDVPEGERLKGGARHGQGYGAAAEVSLPIAIVDVDPPALKRRHQVQVTVVIQVPDDQGASWHDRPRPGRGESRV